LSDGDVDRGRVALPAIDRYLPHRVQHAAEYVVVPQIAPGQRADLPMSSEGRTDDERIPRAVVVGQQQRGAG
jgi:hypothetical protein